MPDEMTPLWRAYVCVMVPFVATQVCLFCALVVWNVQTMRRRSLSACGVRTVEQSVAAVIPCYLPNEACILRDTIEHVIENMTQLDDLTIYVVYNTPHAMDFEDELRSMVSDCRAKGRTLVVHKVEGSTSKAQNLNDVIPLIGAKFVAIYDADHHPDPSSLAVAANFLQDHDDLDCVQGSMYIRDGGSFLLRTWINAEYFMNYFVNLPMLSLIAGSGWFSGTNGVFRTESLQRMNFDEKAMTEDVDMSMRGVLEHNMRFQFLPDFSSGELAPVGWQAFIKQRMRWAMGWDETMLKFGPYCFGHAVGTPRARFCAFFVLVWRYYMQLNTTLTICVNVSLGMLNLAASAGALEKPPILVQHLNTFGGLFFLCLIASSLLHAVMHRHGVREACGLLLYFMCCPFYVFYNTMMLLVSITRVVTGNQGEWVITERGVPSADAGGVRNTMAVHLAD